MKFLAEDNALTIKLEGSEVVLGLKRQLVIPRANITDLTWQADLVFRKRLWRLAGTGIPGALYAGRFRGEGESYFLYLQQPHGVGWANGVIRARNTLLITVQDFAYKQILLTCDPDIGAGLINWWHGVS